MFAEILQVMFLNIGTETGCTDRDIPQSYQTNVSIRSSADWNETCCDM